jgi:CubicO group peptidase (beta-lactamase class C family)
MGPSPAAASGGGCHYAPENAWPGAAWATASPEAKCVDSNRLGLAIQFAESRARGSGVIIRDGKRIGGWGPAATDYNSASAAKTGTTALAALLARADGLFDDTTLARPIDPSVPSPTVTLQMLLTMTSGISHGVCGKFRAPEGTWSYSNCGMDYAASALDILVGGDLAGYLQKRAYRPIGATVSWDRDPPQGSVGLNWSVEDAARLMLLFLREGRWKAEQLVDAGLLADAIQVANPSAPFDFPDYYSHNGRRPPTFYGEGFWLNAGGVMPGVPADLVIGMGAFSCRDEFFMSYSPSTDLIVVRAGNSLRTSAGCDALHLEGNDDFLALVFEAVKAGGLSPVPGVSPVSPAG